MKKVKELVMGEKFFSINGEFILKFHRIDNKHGVIISQKGMTRLNKSGIPIFHPNEWSPTYNSSELKEDTMVKLLKNKKK